MWEDRIVSFAFIGQPPLCGAQTWRVDESDRVCVPPAPAADPDLLLSTPQERRTDARKLRRGRATRSKRSSHSRDPSEELHESTAESILHHNDDSSNQEEEEKEKEEEESMCATQPTIGAPLVSPPHLRGESLHNEIRSSASSRLNASQRQRQRRRSPTLSPSASSEEEGNGSGVDKELEELGVETLHLIDGYLRSIGADRRLECASLSVPPHHHHDLLTTTSTMMETHITVRFKMLHVRQQFTRSTLFAVEASETTMAAVYRAVRSWLGEEPFDILCFTLRSTDASGASGPSSVAIVDRVLLPSDPIAYAAGCVVFCHAMTCISPSRPLESLTYSAVYTLVSPALMGAIQSGAPPLVVAWDRKKCRTRKSATYAILDGLTRLCCSTAYESEYLLCRPTFSCLLGSCSATEADALVLDALLPDLSKAEETEEEEEVEEEEDATDYDHVAVVYPLLGIGDVVLLSVASAVKPVSLCTGVVVRVCEATHGGYVRYDVEDCATGITIEGLGCTQLIPATHFR